MIPTGSTLSALQPCHSRILLGSGREVLTRADKSVLAVQSADALSHRTVKSPQTRRELAPRNYELLTNHRQMFDTHRRTSGL